MALPVKQLEQVGFRFGQNGPHAARTMMLDDLRLLFDMVPGHANRDEYAQAIIDHNVLGKPTRKARELAYRHLATLYALDLANPLFRSLRRFWASNPQAQPMLALAVALARDPLLRATQVFLLALPLGAHLPRELMEQQLEALNPDRFSAASLKSFAQNVSGTWTAAGLLDGKQRKVRVRPEAYPESIAMMLFIGYLEGRTGQRLFASGWMALFDTSLENLEHLTSTAAHRGLLVFMNAGGVKEVRFPDFLTIEEQRIREEIGHVI